MTGIQPTGFPHIGNYFGAIKQCQELQDSGRYDKVFISIVDLHSITVPQNPDTLRLLFLKINYTFIICSLS